MNSKVFPVLYINESNGKPLAPQIAFSFQDNFECMTYLVGQDADGDFDKVLEVENEKVLIPLKSFFYKESNKFLRTRYLKLPCDKKVIDFKEVCPKPVEKKSHEQINIGSYKGTFCFVFHSASRFLAATESFLVQHGQVNFLIL